MSHVEQVRQQMIAKAQAQAAFYSARAMFYAHESGQITYDGYVKGDMASKCRQRAFRLQRLSLYEFVSRYAAVIRLAKVQ